MEALNENEICWNCDKISVYKSVTESCYCDDHKIAFNCAKCEIAVWADSDEHNESDCKNDDEWYCPECYQSDESEDDDDDDWKCDDCGYLHHYEDKCPIGDKCEKYEKWRKDE